MKTAQTAERSKDCLFDVCITKVPTVASNAKLREPVLRLEAPLDGGGGYRMTISSTVLSAGTAHFFVPILSDEMLSCSERSHQEDVTS